MRRYLWMIGFFAAVMLVLGFPAPRVGLAAERAGVMPSPAADSMACPATASLSELTRALDAAVSGPVGKNRDCMRALFTPEARLTVITPKPDGTVALSALTLDEWIAYVKAATVPAFEERQVKVKTERFGHLAQLWSTYSLRMKPDGAPTVRGINSIQAAKIGGQWKIVGIAWQAETASEKLPPADLP